jgi:uncharacterized protein (DUF1800 family)
MELHTIGIGKYTETDVKEAARALTGWTLVRRDAEAYRQRFNELRQRQDDPNLSEQERRQVQRERSLIERDYPFEFVFRPAQHDTGQKTFLGEASNFDGTDIIDILVGKDECADFICRKLFEHFAYANPEKEVVDRLKAIYFDTGYEIAPIVRAILTSDEFYSDRAYRALFKSPAEYVVGAALAMEATTDGRLLAATMQQLGQVLFDPPSPAGWPGGQAWVNANAIITRSNYANGLVSERPAVDGTRKTASSTINPDGLLDEGTSEAERVVDVFVRLLLDGNLATEDRNRLIEYLHTDADGNHSDLGLASLSRNELDGKLRGLVYLVLSSPLYQLA